MFKTYRATKRVSTDAKLNNHYIRKNWSGIKKAMLNGSIKMSLMQRISDGSNIAVSVQMANTVHKYQPYFFFSIIPRKVTVLCR